MATYLQAIRQRVGRFMAGRQPTPPPLPFGEMGTSGTAVWGGYVQVKERSPEWIGRQKYVTSSELAVNTSIVAAGVHYFLNLVAYPKWTFRAADEDDEESLALAEFADNVVNDMDTPWYNVVRRATMYRFHGFGVQEWTAKHRSDGLIGFKDIESRPQQTIEQWDVDEMGKVLGVWQRSPQTGAMLGIPRDKLLYLVEDTLTDSPEGLGMFRHMADPYQRLRQMQQLEIRAFERDLRGTPIARAPLTMLDRAVSQGVITEAEATAMVNDFKSLVSLQVKQSDTGVIMDSLPYFSDSDAGDQVSAVPQWGFELLSGAGVGHAEIAAAIDRLQREIARIIGVEHLMMGDMGGNRALSEDKSRNLYLIANSVLKYIAQRVKSDILIPLWRLNGFPLKKLPEPVPEDVTFKNAEAITNAIGKMSSAGAVLAPNDPVINDVRDLLGVSRVPDDVMQAGMGAMNPALAGLPPGLQKPGIGHNGGPPIDLGGGGIPGTGGKDPTKKFAKKPKFIPEDDTDVDDDRTEIDPRRSPAANGAGGVSDPAAVQAEPAGRPEDRPGTAQAALGNEAGAPAAPGGTAQIDVNGSKPGGKIEVPVAFLTHLMERWSASQAAANPEQEPMAGPTLTPDGNPKPAGHPTASKPGEHKPELPDDPKAQQADDPKAQQSPGGPQLQPGQDERTAGGPGAGELEKPVSNDPAGQPKAGGSNPAASVDPKMDGAPKAQGVEGAVRGRPGDQTKVPAKDPEQQPEGAPQASADKGPEGKPGAEGKPPVDAKADPTQAKPGAQPLVPQGQDPTAAAGVPGAPPLAEPEMTPERASEILQPYADHSKPPEEENPKDEADALWTRLGQEKDVGPVGEQPIGPDGKPVVKPSMPGVDGKPEPKLGPDGQPVKPAAGPDGKPIVQPAVVKPEDDEAAVRARLRERLEMPVAEEQAGEEPTEEQAAGNPDPRFKPKKFPPKPNKRKRVRL
jgi:hypothetical protein